METVATTYFMYSNRLPVPCTIIRNSDRLLLPRICQGKNTFERLENGLHFDFNIITTPPSSSTKSMIILKKF